MTEPVLTYKKGQGWVYETHVTCRGKFLEFHFRKPEIGERFTYITYQGPADDWFVNGVLSTVVIEREYQNHKQNAFNEYDGRPLPTDKRHHFITVVPLT